MADSKCIPEPVAAAERELWGHVADAQCLVEIFKTVEETGPFSSLACSVLQRLSDAVDAYHQQLLSHGVPSLEERTAGVQPARI